MEGERGIVANHMIQLDLRPDSLGLRFDLGRVAGFRPAEEIEEIAITQNDHLQGSSARNDHYQSLPPLGLLGGQWAADLEHFDGFAIVKSGLYVCQPKQKRVCGRGAVFLAISRKIVVGGNTLLVTTTRVVIVIVTSILVVVVVVGGGGGGGANINMSCFFFLVDF